MAYGSFQQNEDIISPVNEQGFYRSIVSFMNGFEYRVLKGRQET
jgi:hypothetical protein